MSFTARGLLLNECIQVARLHVPNDPWQNIPERTCTSGSGQLPKATSNRRVLRKITIWLATLSDDEQKYLIKDADRYDQKALVWLACCRTYRFIREFAVEVIRERYLSYQPDIPLELATSCERKIDCAFRWVLSIMMVSPSGPGRASSWKMRVKMPSRDQLANRL